MNMKFNPIRFAALAAVFTLAACDEIDAPDRFEELPAIKVERCVLIEEFTGQMCTNCPDAHRLINELHAQYGDQVITVGIHSGSFGMSEEKYPTIPGLMQPEGNEYAAHWGVDSYPAAVINRQGSPLSSNAWADVLRTELARTSELNLEVVANPSPDADAPKIDITTTLSTTANLNGKLQLWVVENGITAFQIDNGANIMDYEHNHVFRATVNGTWGEDLPLTPNVPRTLTHSIVIRENWKMENLAIVAFYYTEKEGVLQAAQCRVVEQP